MSEPYVLDYDQAMAETPYPQTADDARQTVFHRAHQAYGSNDPNTLFGPAPTAVAPWPKAGRLKGAGPQFDPAAIRAVLESPPVLEEFDPRHLHATQGSITRPGVDFYLNSPDYDMTGVTFADHDNPGNHHPVIYDDNRGRHHILSGHHRAATALLRGEPLRGRRVTGPNT